MNKYPISSYNKYICLKANGLMITVGLYLLKPYILALVSLTNRKDRTAIIDLFYPDKINVSFEAAASIPFLFLVYALTRRSPSASQIVQKIWRNGKQLIMATAFLQLCVTSAPLWLLVDNKMTLISWAQLSIYLLILVITPLSTYMKDCFSDFPEENKSGE